MTCSTPTAEADTAPMARTDPRHGRARRPYKIRGPETWALIRESYLAGASARQLAERYGVTEWAIWRRAWKEGWTKRDRVEPTPPPALTPLMPGGDGEAGGQAADAATLSREALRGVSQALSQSRLDEARQLAQLAVSLGRLGGGTGGGGYSLADIVRALFDEDYRTALMTMHPDHDNPPEKREYWNRRAARGEENGDALARIKSEAYREGRDDLRAELGLEPEPKGLDAYHHLGAGVVRKGAVEVHPDGGYRMRLD